MKKLPRLIRINHILMRNGLDQIVLATHLFRPLRYLMFLNPYYWTKNKNRPVGERIRCALEELGPIFVKFGQILSTRRDLLPDDIADELVLLQDRVPPFGSHTAKSIIEQSLKCQLSEVFAEFDMTPLASASVAQVHAATLYSGEAVVIKVLRPDIEKIIRNDLALMYTIAQLAEKYWSESKRFRPIDVVAEFEHSIIDELDLLREAGNASQLRRNFAKSKNLYVPEIHWPYCRRNIMVMERIYGIPVSDLASLHKAQINLKKLAESGVEIFFTQVFRDCFFHADMHAGNIFVSRDNPESPKYIAVDFGIMGTLTPEDQHYLAYNMLAFFHRDYRRVTELHVESGWVPTNTRVDEFESAIRTVCEPIFERPIKDISFGHMLLRLFQTARRFNMQVQPQLILLQKTLLNIEGLGRQLYPELNLWETAQPFLEKWMHTQVGFRALYKKVKTHAPFWSAKLADLPEQIFKLVEQQKSHHILIKSQTQSLKNIQNALARNQRKNRATFLLIALFIGCVLLYTSR